MAGTQQLFAALQALYHQDGAEIKEQANRYLEQWQSTTEAWSVSDAVLHDPNSSMESQYFCAQTLRTKVWHGGCAAGPCSARRARADCALVEVRCCSPAQAASARRSAHPVRHTMKHSLYSLAVRPPGLATQPATGAAARMLFAACRSLQVQRDFEELPDQAIDSLRDSLITLLLKYSK